MSNGKGSDRRPETNPGAYKEGYDRIFGVRTTKVNLRRFLGLDEHEALVTREWLKSKLPGPSMLKAYVDPSITCAGVALFVGGRFTRGYLIRPKKKGYSRLLEMQWGLHCSPEVIYFEEPILRMYGRGPASKPADLIKLAASAGALVAQVSNRCPVGAVKPHEWKGSIPKEVTHTHMWTVLAPEETKVLKKTEGPKSLIHNLYDAVCIGLYLEGRAPWKRLDKKHLIMK